MTFCGCDRPYGTSRLALFGAPFDGSASFRTGARLAPAAMRRDSWGLETYSPELDRDLEEVPVSDLGDLDLPAEAAEAIRCVEGQCGRIFDDGKIPLMLGGDHSLTQGAVRAAAERFPDLRLVHIDAHTDLRDQYQGDRLSHASVLRRCHEILGDGRIHLLGVRSGLREEFDFARAHGRLHAFSLEAAARVPEEVGNAPVYLSLDLDILDPSILPGTGSPEPGGVNYRELLVALTLLSPLRIVGSDIMELAPALDPSGASTAVACKLLREWLLLLDRGACPFPGRTGKRAPGLAPESKIRRAGMDTLP